MAEAYYGGPVRVFAAQCQCLVLALVTVGLLRKLEKNKKTKIHDTACPYGQGPSARCSVQPVSHQPSVWLWVN